MTDKSISIVLKLYGGKLTLLDPPVWVALREAFQQSHVQRAPHLESDACINYSDRDVFAHALPSLCSSSSCFFFSGTFKYYS